MAGITDLATLLTNMSPVLMDGEFVFCTQELKGDPSEVLAAAVALKPLATFVEPEGLTLVLAKDVADQHGLGYEGVFKGITLTVHSSLEAVGLTAAVATRLSEYSISANVIAAYYHDHVFVPVNRAEEALQALATMNTP